MRNLTTQVVDMMVAGNSRDETAKTLDIPVDWVDEIMTEYCKNYSEPVIKVYSGMN